MAPGSWTLLISRANRTKYGKIAVKYTTYTAPEQKKNIVECVSLLFRRLNLWKLAL